jgi:hypothetical protein
MQALEEKEKKLAKTLEGVYGDSVWADIGSGESPLEASRLTKEAFLDGCIGPLHRTVTLLQQDWATTLAAVIDLHMDRPFTDSQGADYSPRFGRESVRWLHNLNLLWRRVIYDLETGNDLSQDGKSRSAERLLARLSSVSLGKQIYDKGTAALEGLKQQPETGLDAASYLAVFYRVVTDIEDAWTHDKGDQLTTMVMNQYHDWNAVVQRPRTGTTTLHDSDLMGFANR